MKYGIFISTMFCVLTSFFQGTAIASPWVYSEQINNHTNNKNLIIQVHSWDEQEHQRRYRKGIKEAEEFRRSGGSWSEFKRRHRRQIRKFAHGRYTDLPHEKKNSYYYYNYNYGYISDNCQFIKAPKRFCWFDNNDRRKCRWRLKWQYKCF